MGAAEFERRRRRDDRRAPLPADPEPEDRAGIRALQRSAGNAAVARLLSSASRPVLSRTPRTWGAATAKVVQLPAGNAATSFWPPVVEEVQAYARHSLSDRERREETLARLEDAIGKWQANQSKNWFSSDLDKRKQEAVGLLTGLIAQERDELRAPASQPAAPAAVPAVPAAAGPGPPARVYERVAVDPEDKSRVDKAAFNHFVDRLLTLGREPATTSNEAGANAAALDESEVAGAAAWILKELGGGYGEYGPACRKAVPGVVADANALRYNISREDIRRTISSLTLHKVGFDYDTTISTTKSTWGGFMDLDASKN